MGGYEVLQGANGCLVEGEGVRVFLLVLVDLGRHLVRQIYERLERLSHLSVLVLIVSLQSI